MWSDLSQYIVDNYSKVSKIVEVGVGSFEMVALKLREQFKMDIITTDIKPSHEGIIQDDISRPDLKIYKGASLIYSVRPPEELHPFLVAVAERVGSDLIIKPLSTDSINSERKMELINYKKAVFYKMCHHELE
jgi:uncharacterized protein